MERNSNSALSDYTSGNPKISVVIPLYNKAHTIVKTLNTVFAQTYQYFEVIIVNDGSTDESIKVIHDNFNDSRIRIFHQTNSGVSAARNRGVDEAKGNYIAFLDADDEWFPQYLAEAVDVINNFDCNIIITGRLSQDTKVNYKRSCIPTQYKNKVSHIDFFENPHVFMHISATIIKSNILKQQTDWNRFIQGQKYNEDFTFLYRVIMHYPQVVYIGKDLSIYNGGIDGQSTSVLSEQQRLIDGLLFRNSVWNEYRQITHNKTKEMFKRFMRYETRHTVLCMIKSQNYKRLHLFLKGLNNTCKTNTFNYFELFVYNNKRLKLIAMLYIYYTKIIWRSHRFPRIK